MVFGRTEVGEQFNEQKKVTEKAHAMCIRVHVFPVSNHIGLLWYQDCVYCIQIK